MCAVVVLVGCQGLQALDARAFVYYYIGSYKHGDRTCNMEVIIYSHMPNTEPNTNSALPLPNCLTIISPFSSLFPYPTLLPPLHPTSQLLKGEDVVLTFSCSTLVERDEWTESLRILNQLALCRADHRLSQLPHSGENEPIKKQQQQHNLKLQRFNSWLFACSI